MYTIDKYLNDMELLASSLVIKHHDIGVVMNKWLFLNSGIASPYDPAQWKYYLNLSGVKHATNTDVKITVSETGLRVSLTKELLAQYRVTQLELDSRLDSYKALLEEYPDDILYINGCINPVDINTAIAAPNGAVLSYSKQYIEPQEYSMIRELSTMLAMFFDRWYIKEYNITDDLYMASVISVMYSNIPNMIATIRLNDAYTSEAHSFHIEHFFRSHLDIWDNVKELDHTTIRWLYRNLKTLMNNVGTTETLSTVIDKLFTPNGIGLANYTLTSGGYVATASRDAAVPVFTINPPTIGVKPLNIYYHNPTPPKTVEALTTRIVNTNPYNIFSKTNDLPVLTQADILTVGANTKLTQPTKVIDFGKILLFKTYSNSLLETVLDNWLILANGERYVQNIAFNDPNTKDVYQLDPMSGLLLFYQLLFKKIGTVDPLIQNIRYANVINSNITKANLLNKLLSATGNEYIADIILNKLPVFPRRLNTVTDFQTNITKHIQLYKDIWTLDANANNTFLSANIKEMVYKIYTRGTIQVTPTNTPILLSTLLSGKGVSVNFISGYDIDLSLVQLLKSFTGYELHENVTISKLYTNLERLLEKLTSYSIQTISSDIVSDDIQTPYSSIAINETDRGYIQVRQASTVRNLEIIQGDIFGKGNDFLSEINVSSLLTLNRTRIDAIAHLQIVAHGELNGPLNGRPTIGSTYAEILHYSYIKYAPASYVAGNNWTGLKNINVIGTNQPATPRHNPFKEEIYAIGYNVKVTYAPTATAEVVGNDHTIYAPATDTVANSYNTTGVYAARNAGTPPVVVTHPTVDNIYAVAHNTKVTSIPITTAEVVGSNYPIYAPATDTVANSYNGLAVYDARNAGTPPVVVTHPTAGDIYTVAHNTKVTSIPITTAEVVGSNYPIYAPATDTVANSYNGLAVYDANSAGTPPVVVTHPTVDDIYAVAHNVKVTSIPTATAEVVGSNYPPYVPATDVVANSYNGIGVYDASSAGTPPVVVTHPTAGDIYVTAHNTKVTSAPTVTAEVVGSNYTKP